jgi:hypothetical protein
MCWRRRCSRVPSAPWCISAETGSVRSGRIYTGRNICFARVSYPDNFSPRVVPAGCGAFQAETNFSNKYKPMTATAEDWIEPTIEGLLKCGLVRDRSELFTRVQSGRHMQTSFLTMTGRGQWSSCTASRKTPKSLGSGDMATVGITGRTKLSSARQRGFDGRAQSVRPCTMSIAGHGSVRAPLRERASCGFGFWARFA